MTESPIPKPSEGQSEQDFVSSCMSWMHSNESERPKEQQLAMCYSSYRQHRGEKQDQSDILLRLNQLKDALVSRFKDKGLAFFQYTLSRMGMTELADGTFKGEPSAGNLPFVKSHNDGSVEFINVPLFEMSFEKLDAENHVIGGYANVCVADCDDDLLLPESYSKSVEDYMQYPVVYFSHNYKAPPAGTILKGWGAIDTQVDKVGWYVVSQVAKEPSLYWQMILDGRLNGYSVAGKFKASPIQRGKVAVWGIDSVQITDVSYVPRPCNKLSVFDLVKGEPKTNFTSTNNGTVFFTEISQPQLQCNDACGNTCVVTVTNTDENPEGVKMEKSEKQQFDKGGKMSMSEKEEPQAQEPTKTDMPKNFKELYQKIAEEAKAQALAEASAQIDEAKEAVAVEKEKRAISKLPDRMEALETEVHELVNLYKEDKKAVESRLSKMEDTPDRKQPSESEDFVSKALSVYETAGGGMMGMRAFDRAKNKLLTGEGA